MTSVRLYPSVTLELTEKDEKWRDGIVYVETTHGRPELFIARNDTERNWVRYHSFKSSPSHCHENSPLLRKNAKKIQKKYQNQTRNQNHTPSAHYASRKPY